MSLLRGSTEPATATAPGPDVRLVAAVVLEDEHLAAVVAARAGELNIPVVAYLAGRGRRFANEAHAELVARSLIERPWAPHVSPEPPTVPWSPPPVWDKRLNTYIPAVQRPGRETIVDSDRGTFALVDPEEDAHGYPSELGY